MSEPEIYPVAEGWAAKAHMDAAAYQAARLAARQTPDAYWAEVSKRLDWITPPTVIKDVSFKKDDFRIHWFADGVLNVAYNCVDRHLAHRADQTAIIFEGDDPSVSGRLTYAELHREVCRMANVLKALGAKKGDRITIYLPMIPRRPSPCWPAPASARSIR